MCIVIKDKPMQSSYYKFIYNWKWNKFLTPALLCEHETYYEQYVVYCLMV